MCHWARARRISNFLESCSSGTSWWIVLKNLYRCFAICLQINLDVIIQICFIILDNLFITFLDKVDVWKRKHEFWINHIVLGVIKAYLKTFSTCNFETFENIKKCRLIKLILLEIIFIIAHAWIWGVWIWKITILCRHNWSHCFDKLKEISLITWILQNLTLS